MAAAGGRGPTFRDPEPPPSCDLCGDEDKPLARFNLIARIRRADGRPSSRGAGAVDLCERCWRKALAKRKPNSIKRAETVRRRAMRLLPHEQAS
jgi:hypothetical protein